MKHLNKLFYFLPLFFFSNSSFAQEKITEFSLSESAKISEKTSTFGFYNDVLKVSDLIYINDDTLVCNQYNAKYLLEKSSTFNYTNGTKYDLLDYYTSPNNVHFFYSNKKTTKFDVITYNQKSYAWETKANLALPEEYEYVSSFNNSNKYFVLGIKKNTSTIGLFKLNATALELVKTFNFDETNFDKNNASLYQLLSTEVNKKNKVKTIGNASPLGIKSTKNLNKLYLNNEKVHLTIDNQTDKSTTIFTFNLAASTATSQTVQMNMLECVADTAYTNKSNSFLYENMLTQVNVCREEMLLRFYDLEKKKELKSIQLKNSYANTFKNYDNIINHSGNNSLSVEVVRTKMLLLRMSQNETQASISAYKVNDTLHLMVGAVTQLKDKKGNKGKGGGNGGKNNEQQSSPAKNNGGGNGGGGGGNGQGKKGNVTASTTSAPSNSLKGTTEFITFSDYKAENTIYFIGKMNSTLGNTKGSLAETAFDKIKNYTVPMRVTASAILGETLFKNNNAYIYGYYDSIAKKYILVKF